MLREMLVKIIPSKDNSIIPRVTLRVILRVIIKSNIKIIENWQKINLYILKTGTFSVKTHV